VTYLLVSVLHRRARLETLMPAVPAASWRSWRTCRLIDMTGRKGRPRLRLQIEEIDEDQKILAPLLGAVPTIL
jgi:hypothetical protein